MGKKQESNLLQKLNEIEFTRRKNQKRKLAQNTQPPKNEIKNG